MTGNYILFRKKSFSLRVCVPLYGQGLLRAEACARAGVQQEVSRHRHLEILHCHAESTNQQAHAPEAHDRTNSKQLVGHATTQNHDAPSSDQQNAQTEEHGPGKWHLWV